MERVVFEDIEVDRCDGCGGIWFDLGEEAKLRRLDGSESIDDGDPFVGRLYNSATRIDCPRDGTAMRTLNDPEQRHLQYEVCPDCLGAFFDAGEFTDFKETGANLARLLENIWR
jgi:Zn-finger nucleic acid-binding protein